MDRKNGMIAYMENIKKNEPHLTKILDISWKILNELLEVMNNQGYGLSIPDACPGENNDFMYVWNKEQHYLECEILLYNEDSNSAKEFFYRNRDTHKVWGLDLLIKDEYPQELIDKLLLFI